MIVFQCFGDGLVKYELFVYQFYCLVYCGVDYWFVRVLYQLVDDVWGVVVGVFVDVYYFVGYYQVLGGEIDQNVVVLVEMVLLVGGGQFVVDQCVGGCCVRYM